MEMHQTYPNVHHLLSSIASNMSDLFPEALMRYAKKQGQKNYRAVTWKKKNLS